MGMAATQARFLSLTARRSNIEFQGQQINQQRTTLSNQSASYYSQLCNMAVPTPPSVDDYTKVSYTFNDGAMTNTITTMLTNPNRNVDGAPYLLSYIQEWQDDYTPVEAAQSFISRVVEDGKYEYYIGSTKLEKLASLNPYTDGAFYKFGDVSYDLKQDEDGNLYVDRPSDDGTMTKCSDNDMKNMKFAIYNEDDNSISEITRAAYEEYMKDPDSVPSGSMAVAYLFNENEEDSDYATQWVEYDGKNYYKEVTYLTEEELENVYYTGDAQARLKQEEAYKYLLNQKYNNGENKEWYVRYVEDSTTGIKVPYFYQESDLTSDVKYTDEGYASIKCYSIGSATRTKEVLNQPGTVERDSSGRYIAITLYETDENGEVDLKKSTTYSLTTTTITDEAAYNDALNEYKYQQAKYDQTIQDINSKLEIVQQQDKSLELNLKQLDTEEQAINTEIEAVTKILSKNVSETFKTFSQSG